MPPDLTMPEVSLPRQELLAKQLARPSHKLGNQREAGLEFHHDNQKLTVANNLFQTVAKGNINKVRRILNRGININIKNDYGVSPLVAALHIEDSQKRENMFSLLLSKGAEHKSRDRDKKRSVLLWAVVLGQTKEVSTLLEETAGDINMCEKDLDGFTALHHAVRVGSLPIVEKLVEFHARFGVTVDTVDKLGLTPYLHARRLGYRDVAAVLKEMGLASCGHGDNLFRSPREWSQIGKFERKKAIELDFLDQINAAKIMGKANVLPVLDNFPRMSIPGIVVPSFRPQPNHAIKKAPHYLSSSLPSLSQAAAEENTDRPSSARNNDGTMPQHTPRDGPGPPSVAFADTNEVESKSTQNGCQVSNSSNGAPSNKQESLNALSSNSSNAVGQSKQSLPGQGILKHGSNPTSHNATHVSARTAFAPVRTTSSLAALDLLQQSSRGRMANHFHHSQFDKSKASEYKNMLGNLNTIMDVLSHQQTKSFRKSVEVKKPETPPKVTKKNKVSTWAIIFGGQGGKSAKRKKQKSTGNLSGKKRDNASTKTGKSSSLKGTKSVDNSKSKASGKKTNSLPVPTIKLN